MPDSFATIGPRVPTSVPGHEIVLRTIKGTPNIYVNRYGFDVLDAAGEIMDVRSGDITPHATGWTLTAGQKTALGSCTTVAAVLKLLQDFLQTKAEGVID